MKNNANTYRLIAISLPPFLMVVVGLFHPHQLTIHTARQWTFVHTLLLPLFPLLGASYFVLLSRFSGWTISIAKICIGIYIIFYSALDSIAGIANGVIVSSLATRQDTALRTELITNLRQELYLTGNSLGIVGSCAFVGAVFFTFIYFAKKNPSLKMTISLTGVVLGTGLFTIYHLYLPWGPIGMLVLGASMMSLEISSTKK